jgi:hypothetical protein
MINIKYVSLISFIIYIYLDYIIKNNYLGSSTKNYYIKFISLNNFYIIFIFNIIFFFILFPFNYFDIGLFNFDYYSSLFETDIFNNMGENESSSEDKTSSENNSNSKGKTTNVDSNIHINHPRLNVSVPTSTLNNAVAAGSATGGGYLALKVAQNTPGSPGVKIAAGVGTYLTVQATTAGLGKILNNMSSNSSNNNSKQFINLDSLNYFSQTNGVINNLNDRFNDFPLSLLPEINQLVIAELMFLFIILNIFIVKYITTFDYNKYIPNNKIGRILNIILNRYITIWSKSVKLLLIVSWVGIFVCVIFSKIFLYYILNS